MSNGYQQIVWNSSCCCLKDTIVFILCDLIALVIQAIGGAGASIAVQTGGDPEKGAKIMVSLV